MGAAFALLARDARRTSRGPAPGMFAALSVFRTSGRAWALTLFYFMAFGGFVAMFLYLPKLLTGVYDLSKTDAGARAAGFALLAVLARPVGGWVADRFGPARPLVAALGALALAAAAQACTPPFPVTAGLIMPIMAVALGVASSATLVQVAAEAGRPMVGLVTGLVTAVAGLAGFATPLVMAFSYARLGRYGPAVALFAVAAAAGAWSAARHRADGAGPQAAA
jgi:NNP family nitrate/nitrite transporter-like MFS transporter